MTSKLMEMIEKRTKRPAPDEALNAVSSHWKLIKNVIKQDSGEDPKKLDEKQSPVVGHGVHPVKSLRSEQEISFVAFNSCNDIFLCVDRQGKVFVFLPTGHREDIDTKDFNINPISGIVYAKKTKNYVAWGRDEKVLLLSHDGLKVKSVATSVSRIFSGIYNESKNEIVTGGVGNITSWSFRYGAKFLLQRKVFSDDLSESSVISLLCLEDTLSKSQRCFAAYDSNVIIYNLLTGNCVRHLRELHPRKITAILFFNSLKYLVTAAKDGAIKVWDDKGNVKIIFVGHLKSVNTLALYPFGPYIMSGSSDCTIRVWSLDTADEVDRINTKQAVLGLGSLVGRSDLYSFGSKTLDLWKLEHIHSVFATIGSKIKSIQSTTHPRMPQRLVCTCCDSTVRLLSPVSGDCITTLLLPGMSAIAGVAYAAAENLLFALLANGQIVKSSTMTNPCKILQKWNMKDSEVPRSCSCLCIYEYVIEDEMEEDSWGNLMAALKSKKRTQELQSQGKTNAYERTLLLGGCVDGTIVVFDWQNEKNPGKVSFLIEAHREEVITMVANPVVDQLISAGLDNVIKIWRLFPFAQEALALLMTLFCQETPRFLSAAHHRLCAAFHEPTTAAYNVIVFKTTQKKRFDHNSDCDHMDDVTGLASCTKMRLFASCSADGSVRIWDESNRLLRVVKLNASPTSICFSSQKGDLVVGIGKHLHKINYANYMPQSYIFRMVAMDFRRMISEGPIEIDPDVKNGLTSEDSQRLLSVKSSLHKYSRFTDMLPQDEMNEKLQEEERRNEAFVKLQEREDELLKLRDGTFEFSRKRSSNIDTETVREEAFDRYMDIFYKRPHMPVLEDDLESNLGLKYEEEDVYAPERSSGFFSISGQSAKSKKGRSSPKKARKPELMSLSMPEFEPVKIQEDVDERTVAATVDLEDEHEAPTRSDRPFTMETVSEMFSHDEANSRMSHSAPSHKRDFRSFPIEPPILNRDRYVVDVPRSERYPSSIDSRQLVSQRLSRMAHRQTDDEDEEMFVIAPDGFIPNSVVVAMFKDFREESKEEAAPWKLPQLTAEQLAELDSRKKDLSKSPERESPKTKKDKIKSKFADQLRLALRDVPSPEPIDDADLFKSPSPTPPPSPPTVEEPPVSPPPSPKKEVKPLRPIKKLVTRPKPPTPTPTPPKEPTPTPPPPPTPLPSFITQFKGTLWFEKFFPDSSGEAFPKPWTVESFVQLLLSLIPRSQDYELKSKICAAIMLLHRQEVFNRETAEKVSRSMIAELNTPDYPTAHGSAEGKQFLRVALQLSHSMRVFEVSFVAELMAQFIDGDEEIKNFVQELFVSIGVPDTAGFFTRALDSFDTSDLPDNKRKVRLKDSCIQWINQWLGHFKQHVRILAGKISRAQAGSVVKGTKSPKTPGSLKGILKKEKGDKQRISSASSKPTGTICTLRSKILQSTIQRKVSFDLETLGGKVADTASPAEAINYFCDIRMEEELERVRAQTREKTPVQVQDNTRNTVLVLPKIHSKRNLARLGETHCSHCHPERETSLAVPLPPIYQARRSLVLNNMVLHLNTLTLNPFPDEDDLTVYEASKHSQLITLRSSQKYFFPEQSRNLIRSDKKGVNIAK